MTTDTRPPADTRIMRIVHSALRRDIARAAQVLRTTPPPAQTQRVALADHLVWMMHFLHLHHSGEDRGLWPLVRELNPAAGALLDAMDADHTRIGPEMERVTAAATEYRVHPAAREDLSRSLAALEQVLLPHLQREEDEMMPVVARTLTCRQWDDVEQQVFIASKTKRELGIEAHWIVDGVDREDYDVTVRKVDPATRFMLLHAFKRPYRRACAARWGADLDVSPRLHQPVRTEGSAELWIDIPARQLYDAVADVTRISERSPECRSCAWLPGRSPGTVGARFRGHNRAHHMRWSRVCEVTAADPGRKFEFHTVSDRRNPLYHDSTTWSYTFRADGDGTRVTHAYRIDVLPYRPLLSLYSRLQPQHRDMRPQMQQNLEALRLQARAGTLSGSSLPRTA
ncbi:hemerythrin domain-containing protein [Rhodococcus sp. ACPA1]|uniref:hemerythrin domain-containing protein n=1 Tax=Rhodococcus sp. ACPA1 TaxID=2028572 RepID=UPI000BB0E5AE|nr:hemerythrin domain-containing protein [Rhodococcus sp. ACPA1]PBC57556.1 polyketide cyclase [Rhodococcus sp. ACPA1]